MSIAVPIAIVVAMAASVSAQLFYSWPNYKTEQKEISEQAAKSSSKDKSEQKDENSSKEKSGKSGESSSKDKSGKSDESSSAVVSNTKRHSRMKRQE